LATVCPAVAEAPILAALAVPEGHDEFGLVGLPSIYVSEDDLKQFAGAKQREVWSCIDGELSLWDRDSRWPTIPGLCALRVFGLL
jgi:hypothetical protein